jgi:hypothetical protein
LGEEGAGSREGEKEGGCLLLRRGALMMVHAETTGEGGTGGEKGGWKGRKEGWGVVEKGGFCGGATYCFCIWMVHAETKGEEREMGRREQEGARGRGCLLLRRDITAAYDGSCMNRVRGEIRGGGRGACGTLEKQDPGPHFTKTCQR